MKISDLDPNVRITDLENFFSIYEDKRGYYSYNLNETVYFNLNNYLTYKLKTKAFWPLISYKLYNTTRLAWFLMKINNVKADDIFKPKLPGDEIKYVSKEVIENIVQGL